MKHWVNNFFGLLLGLLGFSSCFPKMYGTPDFRAEYGVPHATYKLNAEATDEEGNPVEGIRVVVASSSLVFRLSCKRQPSRLPFLVVRDHTCSKT